MEEILKRLKEIKKDGISEREFLESVLTVVKDMEDVRMDDENFELLKNTLLEIGCKDYCTWKEEKEKEGKQVNEYNIREGISRADLGLAVCFISQLLYTRSDAVSSLSRMLDGGEICGWVQSWLRRSKELSKNITFKEISEQMKNRCIATPDYND